MYASTDKQLVSGDKGYVIADTKEGNGNKVYVSNDTNEIMCDLNSIREKLTVNSINLEVCRNNIL